MRTLILTFLWLFAAMKTLGQAPWTSYLNEVMTAEDVGTAEWEDTYELLCELEQHPIDLNQATREQLEQLPFLSAQQVEELMDYLYHYGPMKSLSELRMIRSLDPERLKLLTCFVELRSEGEKSKKEKIRSELMVSGHIPFYERKGDVNGYQGYPYRHWLRYQLTQGDRLKAGIVGAQDAGEPFFGGKNRLGYDFYSFYLQMRRMGPIESLILGKYRVSMGMGLIINNSFGLGKVSMLQNMGRPTTTLRPHSSRSSSNYMQGAAVTVSLMKGMEATAFASYRGMDATLNKNGTAATILSDGYHRTERELEKKNNLMNTTVGGHVRYQGHGLHAGLNVVGVHLNRLLSPDTTVLYRRHAAQGYDFLNFSADYGYVHHLFSFNGETAMNRRGALATIHSLSLQLGSRLSLMALHRFYSYRYTSLYSNSYSDGGHVQNESGVYLGVTWSPSPHWEVMAYSDYAYFPWAKYQVSQSSHAWDHLLQLSYDRGHWTFGGRYRLRIRQQDNDDKTQLMTRTEHRGRLSAEYANGWSTRTQVDFGFTSTGNWEKGLMVSEALGYMHRWLRLNGGIGYFCTDSYNSRIYLYESGPLYSYCFSQFSGEGIRYWLMGRATVGKRLMLTLKIGTTNYFDRQVIGTGYQQIKGSSQTDLDLQVRWKL